MFDKKTALRCVGILIQISDKTMRKNVHPDAWWHFILRNESTLEVLPATPSDVRCYFRQGYNIINLYIPSNDFDNGAIYCRDCAIEKLPHFHIPINGNNLVPVPDDNTYLLVDRNKEHQTYTLVDKNFTNMTIHASKLIKAMQTKSINICNATLVNNSVHIRCVDSLITKDVVPVVKEPKPVVYPVPDAKSSYLCELPMQLAQDFHALDMDLAKIYAEYIPSELCTKGSTVASRVKAANLSKDAMSVLLDKVCDYFKWYFTIAWETHVSNLLGYPVSYAGTKWDLGNTKTYGQDFKIALGIAINGRSKPSEFLYITISLNSEYFPIVKAINGLPLLVRQLLPSYLYTSNSEEEPIEYLVKKTSNLPDWVKHLCTHVFSVGHKMQASNGKALSRMSLYELTARLYVDYSFSCTSISPSNVKAFRDLAPVIDLAVKQRNFLNKKYEHAGVSYEELSTSIYMLGRFNSSYFAVATSYRLDDHAVGLVITLCVSLKGSTHVIDGYGFIQTDEDEYSCENNPILRLKNGDIRDDVTSGFSMLARFYTTNYK